LNERWSELLGIPVEEALGRSWVELVSDEGKPLAAEVWRRIVAGPGEYRAEHQLRRRAGDILHVLSQVAPERDARGVVVGWVGTLTDLTDLKHAEFALADSEERLRVALEAAGMASWDADLESARIQWSPNAGSVLGMPDAELPRTGQEGWRLIQPGEVVHRMGNARESLERREPFEIELRVARDGEEPRWILVRGQGRAADSNRGRRVVGVVADVTARHRLAAEREALENERRESQRLESLGLLAGGVAHDFNNLLVGILGNAELALTRLAEEAPVRPLIEELRAAAARAADLAHQILAYSGRGALQSGPVDVAELARDTLALLRPSLPPTARLHLECPTEPQPVAGDVTQLQQVLMNLVTNGCESLDERGGDVTIRISRRSESEPEGTASDWIALEVADTGCGMDPQTRARIFDPFFTTRTTGRGLGLAVVHGIVRAHGGSIDVDSALGEGTRMRLRLPASRAPRAKEVLSSVPGVAPVVASALVLVVDDERAVRGVARLALEAAGHRVLVAANGEEASALLKEHAAEIGAIVLDLTLGRESSESVLTEIRARASDVPVLVTSGYPQEEAIARLSALGVCAFVQKPFTPAQLVESIGCALAGRSS
jgi:PAS domain S-box-containing protein